MAIGTLLSSGWQAAAAESRCFGTVGKGWLEGGVRLPLSGPNFSAYSAIPVAAGRTYVHSKVAETVIAAYGALEKSSPSTKYVYGETGFAEGGPFQPHRTHQNGLSVDFFVPVRDGRGESAILPARVTNRFGYDIEFDSNGRFSAYAIDFPAIAAHLNQLDLAAKARGIGIERVIFDPAFLPKLFATPPGAAVSKSLPFMKGKAWVRHDEHYHVDFAVPCAPKGNRAEGIRSQKTAAE